jgi:hypothetical protein
MKILMIILVSSVVGDGAFRYGRITGEYGTIKIPAGQRRLGARMSVREISSEDPLVEAFRPCERGRDLLQNFAAARPSDHSFLKPRDFLDLHNSAFSGIPEWDDFAEHVSECSRCGAAQT